MSKYNFKGKRFTVYTDEFKSGNKYGVYDNAANQRHHIEGFEAKSFVEAADKAVELNNQPPAAVVQHLSERPFAFDATEKKIKR